MMSRRNRSITSNGATENCAPPFIDDDNQVVYLPVSFKSRAPPHTKTRHLLHKEQAWGVIGIVQLTKVVGCILADRTHYATLK